MRLRELLAADAPPQQALTMYQANTDVARFLGPGSNAAEMFSAMLPEPGAPQVPVPAPENMATLLADSYVAQGKTLQGLGRDDEAMDAFLAATRYGPVPGIARVGTASGQTNFAGYAKGQVAIAYMELAKEEIHRGDYRAGRRVYVAGNRCGNPQGQDAGSQRHPDADRQRHEWRLIQIRRSCSQKL